MRNQKKKVVNYKKILLVIVIIFLFIIIINALFSSKQNLRSNKTLLVIGDSVQELENDIIVESDNDIYMSYDDIKKVYDENIFYDETEKKIITTYNKHIAILELNKNEIEINDAKSAINGKLKFINNILYIPFSDMKIVYDFEYVFSDKTNRLILDSISKNKCIGKIDKNTKVKDKISLFSKNILKIDEGEKIVVLSEDKNYYKIRTQDGIIGYVKKNKVSNLNVIRHDMDETRIENVNFLENGSIIESDYSDIKIDNKKFNVVSPEIFVLEDNKNVKPIISTKSSKYKDYFDWIENNNINLWAKITNNTDVSKMLLTYNDRKEIIDNIYSKLVENNYKFLNIDFKNVTDLDSFYRFVIEITPKLRESGIKTIVTYNKKLDEQKISKIVDYVVKEEK